MITQEYLKFRLRYNPETGEFHWAAVNKHHPRLTGRLAGTIRDGYIIIKIDGMAYRGHRLAWFYIHGVWPEEIDHINRDGLDNRMVNLRECTHAENVRNHGRTCVRILPSGMFQARIAFEEKTYHLGTFETEGLALKAYQDARERLYGEFA